MLRLIILFPGVHGRVHLSPRLLPGDQAGPLWRCAAEVLGPHRQHGHGQHVLDLQRQQAAAAEHGAGNNPAPAAAGATPPKNQGNREARSAIYATAAVPIFDHVFFCSS